MKYVWVHVCIALHLYKLPGNVNLTYSIRNHTSSPRRWKQQTGIEDNVHYFNCGDGFKGRKDFRTHQAAPVMDICLPLPLGHIPCYQPPVWQYCEVTGWRLEPVHDWNSHRTLTGHRQMFPLSATQRQPVPSESMKQHPHPGPRQPQPLCWTSSLRTVRNKSLLLKLVSLWHSV